MGNSSYGGFELLGSTVCKCRETVFGVSRFVVNGVKVTFNIVASKMASDTCRTCTDSITSNFDKINVNSLSDNYVYFPEG